MFLTKLKLGTLLALTATAATLGLAAADPGGQRKAKPDTPVIAEAAKPDAANPAPVVDGKVLTGDLKTLQGYWEAEVVGEKPMHKLFILVHGEVMTSIETGISGMSTRAVMKLSPEKLPKWIDLTPVTTILQPDDGPAGTAKGDVRGIYRLNGDDLEMMLGEPGGHYRPTEFDARPTALLRPLRLKRTTGPQVAMTEGRRKLLGRWQIVSMSSKGIDVNVTANAGVVEFAPEFVFIETAAVGVAKFAPWQAGHYVLDEEKSPKWIDLDFGYMKDTRSVDIGHGVYELDGDTLRVSYRRHVPSFFRQLEFRCEVEPPYMPPHLATAVALPPPINTSIELKRIKP